MQNADYAACIQGKSRYVCMSMCAVVYCVKETSCKDAEHCNVTQLNISAQLSYARPVQSQCEQVACDTKYYL